MELSEIQNIEEKTTLSDDDIVNFCSHITSTPETFIGDRSDSPLYSIKQMVEMFRMGYDFRKHIGIRKRSEERRRTSREELVEYKLRMMEPGDKLYFPIRKHNAARSAASKLKKNFGVLLHVHKETDDTISVVRRK